MQFSNVRKVIYLIVFIFCANSIKANAEIPDSVFIEYEKIIDKKAKEIASLRFNEKLADSLSQNLLIYFQGVIESEGAFNYAFDSLNAIGKVQSKDNKLRIFTWNIVRNNGTYTYYGLLQFYHKPDKEVKTYVLVDKSDSILDPENSRLDYKNWFGALYYNIVETSIEGNTLYTLIGWDGNTLYTNKKVIESLTFTSSGKPKFGSSVFKFGRKKQKRIIFEYTRMADMMISYDEKLNLLVFDHLAPSDVVYENNPAFYGPDFSYDGFKFENNVWNFISDVKYDNIPKEVKKGKLKRKR